MKRDTGLSVRGVGILAWLFSAKPAPYCSLLLLNCCDEGLSMYILGLSAMGHDSSAALLGDSGIVAAMEESKLARTRGMEGIPREAIQYCLERAGIGWRDVSHVAIASDPWRAWRRQAWYRARLAPFGPVSSGYFLNKAFGELGRELNNVRIVQQMAGAPEGRVESLDHHLCHAASAFYASAFEQALVVRWMNGRRACGVRRNWRRRIREVAPSRFHIRWHGLIRR